MPGRFPFDEELGRTGGEDTDLFFRLARSGKRFVWCPDAVAHEWVEEERMDAAYMRSRLYRSGQHSVQSRIAVSESPGRTLLTGWAIGAGQVVLHGAMAVASGEIFRRDRMLHRFGMAKGMGKLAWSAHKSFLLGNP
jgi:succinoglycan biosynthesis protein ExoM